MDHPQFQLLELARQAYIDGKIEDLISTYGVLPPLASTFIEAAMYHGDITPNDVFHAQKKWAHEWKTLLLDQIASGQSLTYEKAILKNILNEGYITVDEIKTAAIHGLFQRPLHAFELVAVKGPGLLGLKERNNFESKIQSIIPSCKVEPITPSNTIEKNSSYYLNIGLHRRLYTQNNIDNVCFNYYHKKARELIPHLSSINRFSPQDLFLVDLASYLGLLD